MKYTSGDLFEAIPKLRGDGTVFIVHVCNDQGRMGSGFVVPLEQAHPNAKRAYQEWPRGQSDAEIRDSVCTVTSTGPSQLGQTQFVQVLDQREVDGEQHPRVVVVNMIAQTLGGERPLYYNHLVRCMTSVASLAGKPALNGNKLSIVCPMFGGGLAGGDWRFIHRLIEDVWQRENSDLIAVTVYYLERFVKDTDREVMGG